MMETEWAKSRHRRPTATHAENRNRIKSMRKYWKSIEIAARRAAEMNAVIAENIFQSNIDGNHFEH